MLSTAGIASRTLTFILAGGRGERLYPLTRYRAKPVVPFAGIYRLIDFTLSNCFNSGLNRISILTQYQCESLHSYVRALTLRDFFGNIHGGSLLCFCPVSGKRYQGTADAVFQNLSVLENMQAEYALILSSDHVYKMDYVDLLRFHVDCRADVTLAGVEYPRHGASQFGILESDPKGYAIGFEEKPKEPKSILGKPSKSLINMGVYVFNRRTLMDALYNDAQQNTSHDFGKDIIPSLLRSRRICVYNFSDKGKQLGSYWRDVGTLDAYYRANMELLLGSFLDPYASAAWPLYGYDRPHYPGRPEMDWRSAGLAVDSVIAERVSAEPGSQVIHSVLSPGVQIEDSARVHDSILLHNVRVGAGARIQRAILEENVRVADGVEIGDNVSRDREYGLVTQSGIVVIPANTYVGPPGTFHPPQARWKTELITENECKSRQREANSFSDET
jgi:glucose-1-phosphate adenylyltransferase